MDMLIRRLDLSLYLLHVLLIAPGLGLHLIVCVSFDIQVQVFASAWVHIYCVQCTCLVRTMCISPCLLRTMYMYIVYCTILCTVLYLCLLRTVYTWPIVRVS